MKEYKTYLRAIEPEDIEKINEWHNDEKIFSRTMGNKFFISLERDKAWAKKIMMDDSKVIFWAICLKDSGQMIGSTSITDIDLRNRKAYVGGITVQQEYQNQKLGFDAFEQVLNYCFYDLGLNRYVQDT